MERDITAISFFAMSSSLLQLRLCERACLYAHVCVCHAECARTHIFPPTRVVCLDVNPSGQHVRQCA